MRALFIGGTGTISSAVTRKLAKDPSWELWLINRGNRADTVPENVHQIVCDINDEDAVKKALEGMTFDCVGEFIGFTVDQVERDYRLFKDITKQYIYISSASAYQKPAASYMILKARLLQILTGNIPEIRLPVSSS
jgi:saccharopine dehydrogenase-like NADP-dependent oxidoreductase